MPIWRFVITHYYTLTKLANVVLHHPLASPQRLVYVRHYKHARLGSGYNSWRKYLFLLHLLNIMWLLFFMTDNIHS